MKAPVPNPEVARSVLVVEDEPRLRDMLLRAIPDMGFTPIGASSGEEALRIAERVACSVAILDLNLPMMSGLELFEAIRRRWPQTQVIILTGFGDLEAAKKAIRLNVTDFLTKPCSLGDLEVALDRAWRLRLQLQDQGPDTRPAETTRAAGGEESESLEKKSLQDLERVHILQTLEKNKGNRAATAAELGISVRTLYYRLAEYERKGPD